MILRSLRHHTEEEVEGYRLHSRLTIHQVPDNVPDKVYIGCPPGDQVGLWGVQVREQELSWRDGGSDPALRDCLRVNGGNPQPHRAHQQGAPRQTHNQVALKLLVVARVNLFFQANLSL